MTEEIGANHIENGSEMIKETNLKILVASDFHGFLPNVGKEPFDFFFICGDICPATNHSYTYQYEWIRTVFVEWIKSLPYKDEYSKVIMTWGNHDFIGHNVMGKDIENLCDGRLIILKNVTCNVFYKCGDGEKRISIFGTPWCKIFFNWAFMAGNEKLDKYYSECPNGVDVFISHDSPTLNGLGTITSGPNRGTDAGNTVLDKCIEEKKPKFFFSGHIHSGNHTFEKIGETWMANVCLVDENYEPRPYILGFELDRETLDVIQQYPVFTTN